MCGNKDSVQETEKINVFTTNILASKVKEYVFHFAITSFALHKGPSKLSLDTSPNPRNAPRYLTGDDPTVIPKTFSYQWKDQTL